MTETEATKIAVGLPVYNGADYIAEAIESVLAQSYGDYHLLISDNASTDGTDAICCEFAARDPRVKYIRQSENLGLVGNGRFLLQKAEAYEYYAIIGHDDVWMPHFLETLLPLLENDKAAVLAMGRYRFIDENGNGLELNENLFKTEKIEKMKSLARPDRMSIQPSAIFIHGLIRRDCFIETLFNYHGTYEDVFMLRYFAGLGHFVTSAETVFLKRMHPKEYSNSNAYRAENANQDYRRVASKLAELLNLGAVEKTRLYVHLIFYFRFWRSFKGRVVSRVRKLKDRS